MTRQRKYQKKMKELGNCIKCGAPATTRNFCKLHTEYQNILVRNKFRTKRGIPIDAPLNSFYGGRPTRTVREKEAIDIQNKIKEKSPAG